MYRGNTWPASRPACHTVEMWFALVACTDPPPAVPSVTVPEDSGTDTGEAPTSPDETGSTADTGAEPTLPIACANLPAVGAPDTSVQIDVDPLPFDPRADGLMWFGVDGGVFEGATPGGSAMVWPTSSRVLAVREDPGGTLWFAADDALQRVLPGGVPERIVEGVSFTDDIELHPSGSVALADWDISVSQRTFVFVDPFGVPEVFPTTLPLQAVAWSDTGDLWLLADGLWSLPADAVGRPDWTVAPTQVVGVVDLFGPPGPYATQGGDLEVDSCGGVLISAFNHPFGRVFRYEPVTPVLVALPGMLDQGYGSSPLRFGRLAGTETLLRTSSGGWSTLRRSWVTWDVGVGAL